MPLGNTLGEDNDSYSLSSTSPSSDDDMDECYSHTHRSCSRHASCNKKKHQHSIDSIALSSRSNNCRPTKGQIRPVENEPGHRQKYDGTKWRRICRISDCTLYLTGRIYFKSWLCRKHYLLTLVNDLPNESDASMTVDTRKTKTGNKNLGKSAAPPSNQRNESHKRGDLMVTTDGIRQKYDGRSWRPVCNYMECISFIVRHGYCHRHDMEMRKKNSEKTLPIPNNSQQKKSKSKSEIIRTKASSMIKPKKGEIQLVRQLWNGTKWYSLCHYYTRDCTRRSAGKKYGFLCDAHYKESIEKQKDTNLIDRHDQILISPTVKRKKLIHDERNISLSSSEESNLVISRQSTSTFDRREHTEQCIQTDVTYPLESTDLREGCILIDDDDNYRGQSETSQKLVVRIKKEDDFIIHKRNVSLNINSLPLDCKLELTKLEV